MLDRHRNKQVLMLRPWLSLVSGGDAYAHFDAVAMRKDPGLSHGRYGDYSVFQSGDDARNCLHLDNFRFHCQIDDRHAESYAWSWGYQPDRRGIFSPSDLHRYGPSIEALQKGMARICREDGHADTVGRLIVRLARILKLDGIAVLETSQNGSFREGMEICWHVDPKEYGNGITWINDLVVSLHRTCAQRVGKSAA